MGDPVVTFLTERSFDRRDYVRFRIAELQARGVRVNVVDASEVLYPEARIRRQAIELPGVEMVVLKWEDSEERAMKLLRQARVVVATVGAGFPAPNNWRVLHLLSQSGAPYMVLSNNAIPAWNIEATKRSLLFRLKHIRPLISVFARLPPRVLGLRPARWVVYGGTDSAVPRRLISSATEPIWSHSFDYDTFVAENQNTDSATENVAVFIDQYLGYHPDAALVDGRQPVAPAFFYPRLRRLFDRIEKELGLEVVISAHPRSDYSDKPNLFGQRRIIAGHTGAQVKHARLVVCAYSTAINFAVLYGKPVLLVSCRSIELHPRARYFVRAYAQALGSGYGMLDDPEGIDLQSAFEVDGEAYRDFIERQIRVEALDAGPLDAVLWKLATGQKQTGVS